MHDSSTRRFEKSELERLAFEEGVPGDFDVAQINWKPDCDPFYYG
jgi:hypothetical protein